MGFIFSKSINENMKNQQEFMVMNSRLQLERQILMQNQMREREMAMRIAWTREFLKYFGTFSGLAVVGLTVGYANNIDETVWYRSTGQSVPGSSRRISSRAIKKKKPGFIIPMVPLGFILTYHYDMGYGSFLQRMKGEAENILDTEHSMLEVPKGPLTFDDLEKARRAQSKFFTEK